MEKQLEALREAEAYIKKLQNGVKSSVTHLREGELRNGYEYVVQITEGIDWLLQVVTLTKDVQNRKIDSTMLNQAMEAVIEALENQDSEALADVMTYELLEGLVAMEKDITYNLVQ